MSTPKLYHTHAQARAALLAAVHDEEDPELVEQDDDWFCNETTGDAVWIQEIQTEDERAP